MSCDIGYGEESATAEAIPKQRVISHETTADRLAWFERLVAGAVAKMQTLPEWKRNSLRAQIATMGKGESNVR